MAQPLPLLAGGALVVGWYAQMQEALLHAHEDEVPVFKLLEAGLSVRSFRRASSRRLPQPPRTRHPCQRPTTRRPPSPRAQLLAHPAPPLARQAPLQPLARPVAAAGAVFRSVFFSEFFFRSFAKIFGDFESCSEFFGTFSEFFGACVRARAGVWACVVAHAIFCSPGTASGRSPLHRGEATGLGPLLHPCVQDVAGHVLGARPIEVRERRDQFWRPATQSQPLARWSKSMHVSKE